MRFSTLTLPAALLVLSAPVLAQCEIDQLTVGNLPGAAAVGFDGSTAAFMTAPDGLQVFALDDASGWEFQKSISFPAIVIVSPRQVAVDGDLLVASAGEGGSALQGEVRIYERGKGYDDPIFLEASDTTSYDNFGAAIALHGSTLVVGASMDLAQSASGPGKAYVFERVGGSWGQTERFVPQGATSWPAFGRSVATDGETIVVGSPADDLAGVYSGAAYVYERTASGWTPPVKLFPSSPATTRWFGISVAVHGDMLMVIAAYGASPFVPALHVFTRDASGWMPTQVLPLAVGYGPTGVDFDGDVAVVGTPLEQPAGGARVLEREGSVWVERGRLGPADTTTGFFGWSAAVAGNQALLSGSYGYGNDDPRHYLFSLGLRTATSDCAPTANSSGLPAELTATGCDSVLAGELELRGRHLPAKQLAILYLSRDAAPVPFGNDQLCLGQPEGRIAVGKADANGRVDQALDFDQGPGAAIEAGSTWRFQLAFRDPGFGAGSGTSNALEIRIEP